MKLKFFKKIRTNVFYIKALRRALKDNCFSEERNFEGINYIYSPDTVLLNGATIAITTEFLGEKIIFVDDLFESATDEVKRFTLYHELGHQNLNHIERIGSMEESIKEIRKRNKKDYISEFELEADAYAFSICGLNSALKTFDYMEKVLASFGIENYEIVQRKKAILNK